MTRITSELVKQIDSKDTKKSSPPSPSHQAVQITNPEELKVQVVIPKRRGRPPMKSKGLISGDIAFKKRLARPKISVGKSPVKAGLKKARSGPRKSPRNRDKTSGKAPRKGLLERVAQYVASLFGL